MKKNKKQIQSEETREKILQVSTRFLISRSYHGTTISAIAKEAGLTKGAIYHHFKSKEDLVLEIVKSVKQTWFKFVGRKVLLEGNSVNRLETLLSVHSQFLKNDPTMCLVLSSLLSEMEILDHAILDEIKGIYSEMLSFIRKIIEKGQKNSELQKDLDAENTAFTIVGILRWMGCSPLFKLLNFKQDNLAENTINMLIKSIRK
jgi:AcrR family transcriptional regulator